MDYKDLSKKVLEGQLEQLKKEKRNNPDNAKMIDKDIAEVEAQLKKYQ